MNHRSSSWTGRAARDMRSAFGPYTDNKIYESTRPIDMQDRIVIVACVLALVTVIWMGVL